MHDMKNGSETEYPLKRFYSKIYKSYDLVNRLFTLGQDNRWRKLAAEECIKNHNRKILDLCCGTGDLMLRILDIVPDGLEIHGYDFNPEMLSVAEKKIAYRHGSNRVKLTQGDAAQLPFNDEYFDAVGIAFGFRNLTYKNSNRDKHIDEIKRVLKKGGRLVILESGKPKSRVMRFLFSIYVYTFLLFAGSMLSGSFKAYRYLAKSAKEYYSQDELKSLLESHGFLKFEIRNLFMNSASLSIAVKTGT
jgi:demethylmenaquinone methyltransferase / 2-methoxy-6-polyprenyl-1,4-benzoquinol methylase